MVHLVRGWTDAKLVLGRMCVSAVGDRRHLLLDVDDSMALNFRYCKEWIAIGSVKHKRFLSSSRTASELIRGGFVFVISNYSTASFI